MCYNSVENKGDGSMAIGERIKYIRKLRKMTQRELGTAVGFDEKTADVRMAQYEAGSRTPKADLVSALADELEVSANALTVPDIDSTLGLIHTLFAVEDIYGLTINSIGGEYVLRINRNAGEKAEELLAAVENWYNIRKQFATGEIDEEEYNRLRYNYPDTEKKVVKVEPVEEKQPEVKEEEKIPEEKPEEKKAPTRTVDDILAQLRANLDMLKSIQNDEENE